MVREENQDDASIQGSAVSLIVQQVSENTFVQTA